MKDLYLRADFFFRETGKRTPEYDFDISRSGVSKIEAPFVCG
jgi:hypothetical protein